MKLTLKDELSGVNSVFIDTAPIIYYIEAHQDYGPLMKEVLAYFQSGKHPVFTSVITITEVLPKPVSSGHKELVNKFMNFFSDGENVILLEISSKIAEKAGQLRGKYNSLKTMDAIQIAAALNTGADAFITNDVKLKQVKDVKVIVLNDFL